MNARRENKLSMAKAVQETLNSNTSIVTSAVAFGITKTELDTVIKDIDNLVKVQSQKTTAADKTAAMNKAVDAAIELIGNAKAYAINNDIHSLIASFTYTRSELVKLRDTVLVNTLTMIHDNALLIVTKLTDYGVTAAQITGFKTLIDAYNDLLTTQGKNITTKSAATKALVPAFKRMETILTKLDGFTDGTHSTHNDFYNAYQAVRIIVDNKGKSKPKDVKGKGKDGETPAPSQK